MHELLPFCFSFLSHSFNLQLEVFILSFQILHIIFKCLYNVISILNFLYLLQIDNFVILLNLIINVVIKLQVLQLTLALLFLIKITGRRRAHASLS